MFTLFSSSKKGSITQIGISENRESRCFVWQEKGQLQVHWEKNLAPLDRHFHQTAPLQAVTFPEKFTLIRAIPHHYIWRKKIVVPLEQGLNAKQKKQNETRHHKQRIQILRNELPIALEEVYFDTVVEINNAKNSQSIALYALRKQYADPLLISKTTILDCESHCYARAIQHLTENYADYVHQFNDLSLNITEKSIEILHEETQRKHFDLNMLSLPDNLWDKSLYLTALGASLWQ